MKMHKKINKIEQTYVPSTKQARTPTIEKLRPSSGHQPVIFPFVIQFKISSSRSVVPIGMESQLKEFLFSIIEIFKQWPKSFGLVYATKLTTSTFLYITNSIIVGIHRTDSDAWTWTHFTQEKKKKSALYFLKLSVNLNQGVFGLNLLLLKTENIVAK